MGCFGCFVRQPVDDEPQLESHPQKNLEDQRPATAPAGRPNKGRIGSPVPTVSSHDPLLQSKGGSSSQPPGASPTMQTGEHGSRSRSPQNLAREGESQSDWGQQQVEDGSQQSARDGLLQEVQQSGQVERGGSREASAGGTHKGEDYEEQHGQGVMRSRTGSVASASGDEPSARPRHKALPADEPAAQVQGQSQGQGQSLGPIRDQTGTPIAATTFTFGELERATRSFSPHNFVGEGGFGRVYKGKLESTGQIVAVKQLDRNGLQGNREFLVEVLMLSLLHHPNLVQLIGYCADGDQRLLVYEFMANGALEDHLHDLPESKEALDWNMRMKVAAGAARGLEYLHDKANPPVIYRDFKSSNILLDENWHPKLSDFGLAKLGPVGDKTHVSTRVMGTYGYCAPEYAMTGQLTVKSDVYSFGVVLLELITGRKAIDNTRPQGEHNLVAWARPLFKDRRKFPAMADPLLQGKYPMRGLYQALAVAAMCLQEQASQRPMIHDVVTALSYLAAQQYDPNAPPRFAPGTPQHELGRDRRGSRSPQVRSVTGASPRASPGHSHGGHRVRGFDGSPASPGLGPLGATSSARGYRESPGRSGLGSGRSTPNHPLTKPHYGENMKAQQVPE